MIDLRFMFLLTAGMALAGALAWGLVGRWSGGVAGLVNGLAFSYISLAIGFHAVRWGARKSSTTFVGTVFGSFALRVVAVIVFALVVAYLTEASVEVALVTVVATHILFGFIEIGYMSVTAAIR